MAQHLITFQRVQRVALLVNADDPISKEQLEYWANSGYFGKSPLDAGVLDPVLVSYDDRGRWVAIATHEPKRKRERRRK